MNKSQILNKIIKHYKFNSDAEFARFLSIKPQVLSNWKSRNTYDITLVSKKCVEISPEWLLTGKGPMRKEEVRDEDFNIKKIIENQIPVFNINDSIGGAKAKKNDLVINHISIPSDKAISGVTVVSIDNMSPILKVGDFIMYEEVPLHSENIIYNEMYLLSIFIDEEKTYKTIRYINKSSINSDHVLLVSENKQYLEKELPFNKIESLAIIKGWVHIK